MIFKKYHNIDEINAKIEHLEELLDSLRDNMQEPSDELKSYIRKTVWESMQSWLNGAHENVVTTLNGQLVETRLVKDKVKKLRDKRYELEQTLELIDRTLEKYHGEADGQ